MYALSHDFGLLELTVPGDIRPKVLYGTMKAAQVRMVRLLDDYHLTLRQMGMATQLLFTAIVTLMKVAILLTYLRKLLFLMRDEI